MNGEWAQDKESKAEISVANTDSTFLGVLLPLVHWCEWAMPSSLISTKM